ncbi:RNA-binding S4 domain-containing protein [Guggenheimella bovis]
MRIDKFLKVSRIIKRRTVAKEFCDAGKVSIGENVLKPGDEVKVGDILSIRFGSKMVRYKILSINETASKETAKEMVEEV